MPEVEPLIAVGDIRGGPAFTHTAYADFRVLQSLFLGDGSTERPTIIPYAMFTEPELGRVGMSEGEARAAGRTVKVARREMATSGKAREIGKTAGFIKVVLDANTDEILGATVLATEGAETRLSRIRSSALARHHHRLDQAGVVVPGLLTRRDTRHALILARGAKWGPPAPACCPVYSIMSESGWN